MIVKVRYWVKSCLLRQAAYALKLHDLKWSTVRLPNKSIALKLRNIRKIVTDFNWLCICARYVSKLRFCVSFVYVKNCRTYRIVWR